MRSLAETARRHEERILAHVERLPTLADLIVEDGPRRALGPLQLECAFLGGDLISHMRAVEAVIYPELDRIMSCCHSMLGMRREHRELERLIGQLATACVRLGEDAPDEDQLTAVRHSLHRLTSIAKVHLAEESRLVRVLERNLPAEQVEALAYWLDEHALSA